VSGITAGERRIVSVLVADVAGSTAIAERLGPERSKFLFDDVVGLMREEVERLGGTLAQLTGDGILALFGAPTAHEDDAERAVRTALAIHEALARYAAEIAPAYGIELAARVAVNTGPVVVPSGAAPPDQLYNALGDTVNVAARLQSHAGTAGVAVGPETARQLEASFELEPLGEVELKGKSAPIAAFRVGGERAEPVATALTPLVGRERELSELEDVLLRLVDGRGAIVTVTGEPGIGKSRLKSEARARFGTRVRFLEGHAVRYAQEIPYWSLRELLRDWLGLGVSDPEARVRLELRAALAAVLGDEAREAYSFLAGALGLPLEREQSGRLAELSPDAVQQQTFESVKALVSALAAERPLCLVFEDLHWADEPTLALLEELFAATDDDAFALVLSYRTEHDHAAWDLAEHARRRYRHRFVELALEPLEPQAALGLAASAAGAELPDAVAALLAERSGGNPFFLEEALRDLLERGVLRRVNGRYELANGAEDVAVPALVQEALQARLDRLDEPTREVVSVAAVVGRSFGTPLLERIVPAEELRPALSELQRLDLVVEERRRPAPEYRFRHGLVQEVAYDRLVTSRRRELHRIVGEALEQLHPDSPQEVYGLLARHFTQAGEATRAIDYLLKAADAARAIYADEEAIALYTQALAFMEHTRDDQRSRETLLKMALTHHLAFDYERANDAYREAFARPEPPPPRSPPSESIAVGVVYIEDRDALVPGYGSSDSAWGLCRNLFRGLLSMTPDLGVAPDLAASMEIRGDGLEYRFRLRPDARWSDGVPVSARDLEFTFHRMREDRMKGAHILADVTDVKALDTATAAFTLREPRNYFLYLLALPPFMPWPRHVCDSHGPSWRHLAPLVGNGPYTLEERDDNQDVLRPSPNWSGARGNVGEIRVVAAESSEEASEWWRAGHFDLLPYFHAGELSDADSTRIVYGPAMTTRYAGFASDRPPFDDARLRRAVAHSLDRERLVAESPMRGDPTASGGLIPPPLPGHSARVAPPYEPSLARDLLAEAADERGPALTEFAIVTPSMWGLGKRLADQLAAIGITARVDDVGTLELGDRIETADAWIFGWLADYPDPAGMMTMFGEYPNLYRDVAVDQLVEQARSLQDRDERLRLYRRAERQWIGEQVAIVPLAYSRALAHARPWIDGFWTNGVTTSTFADISVRPELRSAPTPA
jgi:ABC-type transport system substrate-binding protein/class 3 adenylate cyclase